MATPVRETVRPPVTAAALAGRVRDVEVRARALAEKKGGAEATGLVARIHKFAERLAAGGAARREDALVEARRVLAGDHEKNTLELAELVPTVRAGIRYLILDAPDAATRDRLTLLLDVYAELETCLKMLSDAIIIHGMARTRLIPAAPLQQTVAKAGAAIGKIGFC